MKHPKRQKLYGRFHQPGGRRARDRNLDGVAAVFEESGNEPARVTDILVALRASGRMATLSRSPRDVIARDLSLEILEGGEHARFERVSLGLYRLRRSER